MLLLLLPLMLEEVGGGVRGAGINTAILVTALSQPGKPQLLLLLLLEMLALEEVFGGGM